MASEKCEFEEECKKKVGMVEGEDGECLAYPCPALQKFRETKQKIQAFPTTAPYRINPLEFAQNYIEEILKWKRELAELVGIKEES